MFTRHTNAAHDHAAGTRKEDGAPSWVTCGAGSVCKLLDAETLARSPGVADLTRKQVFDVLANGLELCIAVGTRPGSPRALKTLSTACEVLADAVAEAGVSPARLEILVDNPAIAPAEALAARRATIGDGIVHMVAGTDQLRGSRGREAVRDGFWHELWQGSAGACLRVAYSAAIRACSPLLRSEPATTVLPRVHLEVPAGTSWVQLSVDLPSLAGGRGLCMAALEEALRDCVESGERMHDKAVWATPPMREDAWLNRRMAIAIAGIGDLVVQQGMNPSAFSTLEFLDRLMNTAQSAVREQSRAIARRAGHVPALDQTDPCRFLPGGAVRDAWRKRWAEMLATASVRHRNLLAISPWSVFPAGSPADFRFADLLPVLRYADTCLLSGLPDLRRWNAGKFREFHCRASAALQQRESPHQIAEGC